MPKSQVYGVITLGMAAVSILLGAIVIFQASWLLGAIYAALCAVGALTVLYAFCAKCPSRANCGHVFPGRAAMLLFSRQPGPYSPREMYAMIVSLLVIVLPPQFWLLQQPILLAVFWILLGLAIIQIHRVVCAACQNTYCPLRVSRRS